MNVIEVILTALTLAVVLAALAGRLGVPYPILLVLGGIALGFVPALPRVTIDPDVLFLIFIPPLVFSAGWRTSWRDVHATILPVSLLATGLVFATLFAVAIVAHRVVGGLTWPAAFVLGAVLSSTDPLAATAIAGRLHISRRIVTVLEGEGVGNDAASLVAYRTAVGAAVSGVFFLPVAALQIVLTAIGGIAMGVVVGLVYDVLQRPLHNPPLEVALTLVVPYATYIAADQLGVSGVLALLAAGIVAGRRVGAKREARSRLVATAFWDSVIFLLTSLVFVLLGLYLPGIIAELAGWPVALLAGDAALILLTVILVRFAWVVGWVFATLYFPVPPGHGPRQVNGELDPVWKRGVVVAWAGIRGTDALVLALALPFTIASGRPFPGRGAITFLTFTVAVATLLIEGLSLQTLIRQLRLHNDVRDEREEALALAAADIAALERLDEVLKADGSADGGRDDSNRQPDGEQGRDEGARVERAQAATRQFAEHLRWRYAQRAQRFAARAHDVPNPAAEEEAAAAQRLQREVVEAQRRAIISLRDRGEIGDAALQRVLHDLDLEDQSLV